VEVLIFNAPESADFIPGEPSLLVDPTAAQMVALLRRRAKYWGKDSGDASLHWSRPKKDASGGTSYEILNSRPSLSILYHQRLGFHFALSTGRGDKYLVPFNPDAPDRRVLHYLGGNQAFFPAATFVPLKVAEQIVIDFIKTGKPSPVMEWESGGKLRCGDPDN
jgi:hypothetical protein